MRAPASIKVMADYECHPLWDTSPSGPNNLDPANLPLPEHLRSELRDWASEYDATLNRASPAESGFLDPEVHGAFVARGRALAIQTKAALGVTVTYFNDLSGLEERV
jgi:hypothetical protein